MALKQYDMIVIHQAFLSSLRRTNRCPFSVLRHRNHPRTKKNSLGSM
eukprot:CCRYP_012193-RA/>CCRYP_012193-RA protein AED:0.43 eAED:0.43 QI:34/1/1/1/0/0/2/131/46